MQDVEVGPLVREGLLNSWGLSVPLAAKTNGTTTPMNLARLIGSRQYACTISAVSKLGVGPQSGAISAAFDEVTRI